MRNGQALALTPWGWLAWRRTACDRGGMPDPFAQALHDHHFGFATIVYNFWLLVDFLTQDRLGVVETRTKPRITVAQFLCWLERELWTLT